jgi:hypothetical protein
LQARSQSDHLCREERQSSRHITAQHELQWSAAARTSSDLALVRLRIMVFSLLMKRQNAPLEFSIHFANHLNQEQSQLHEALETLPTPHDSS